MEKEYKNKAINQSVNKELNLYHFPGGGEYEPLTVEAESFDEAKKIWEQKRKKVGDNKNNQ
jgi:hypothetical protein